MLGGGAGWRGLGSWSAVFWVWLAGCLCMLSPLCILNSGNSSAPVLWLAVVLAALCWGAGAVGHCLPYFCTDLGSVPQNCTGAWLEKYGG